MGGGEGEEDIVQLVELDEAQVVGAAHLVRVRVGVRVRVRVSVRVRVRVRVMVRVRLRVVGAAHPLDGGEPYEHARPPRDQPGEVTHAWLGSGLGLGLGLGLG